MKHAFHYIWKILTIVLVQVLASLQSEKQHIYTFPVFKTNSCPKSQSEWRRRSNDINCTENNGYICVPNANLTQLLEFCYTIPRSPIEKGLCMILDASSNLDDYSCASFANGCPNTLYWTNEIYKYQNCLSIRNGCFLAEPNCVKERSTKNGTSGSEIDRSISINLLWIISGIVSPVFLIFGTITFIKCWRFFKAKEQRHNLHYTEMKLISPRQTENNKDRDIKLDRRCASDVTILYQKEQGPLQVIDTMLTKRINKTRENIAHGLKQTNELFVKTQGFFKTLENISFKNYAVIKGNMGDGKTTIAYHVLNEKMKEGKKPLQIYSFTEFDELISNENNLVIFIDNMFGEFSTTEVSQWSCRFRALEAAIGSNCLIITIRNDIYNQLRFTADNRDFLERSMVDISFGGDYRLTMAEKRQLFRKYTPYLDISDEILEDSSIMGFPQCCRVLKNSPHFGAKMNSLFLNPDFLREDINNRILDGGMKAALLAFISLKGGQVKKTDLEDSEIEAPLKESVMDIFAVKKNFVEFASSVSDVKDTFVVYNHEEKTYEFCHSSIQIALFLAIGKYYPEKFIKQCHYECLSVVTTERCIEKELQTLCISDEYLEVLGNRVRELMRGQMYQAQMFRVISELPVWEDEYFINGFLEKSNESYCERLDENEWSILVHFAISGCLKWVKHIFENELRDINNRKNENAHQGKLALANACGAHNTSIVNYLINKGVEPDITCCFHAVKGGHMDIVKSLLNFGVDLKIVSKSLSSWDTKTTVLEEAALQKQDHLMIPLLKICPELRNIKSSIGASAVHFAASAGNMELLESLIKEFNFTAYDITDIGSSILHFASQNNKFEAVKFIVNKYPHLFKEEYYCYEEGTILHTAAQSGNYDLFEYMYNENTKYLDNHGKNVIELTRGCYVIIKGENILTVNKSHLLHVRSRKGISLMHRAAQNGCIHLIDFLITNGVDLLCTFENNDGQEYSVFDVARNRETIEYLEKHLNLIQSPENTGGSSENAEYSESLLG